MSNKDKLFTLIFSNADFYVSCKIDLRCADEENYSKIMSYALQNLKEKLNNFCLPREDITN